MNSPEMPDKSNRSRSGSVKVTEQFAALHEMSLEHRRPVSREEILAVVNSLEDKAFVVPEGNERIFIHQSGSYDFNVEAYANSQSSAPYGAAFRIQARCGNKLLEDFNLPLHLINVESQEKLSFRNHGAGKFMIIGLIEGQTYQIKLDE